MYLHTEMDEAYLIQVAAPVNEHILEHEMEMVPHRLGWQDYSEDKNKQSPAQVQGNNEHNPNEN